MQQLRFDMSSSNDISFLARNFDKLLATEGRTNLAIETKE